MNNYRAKVIYKQEEKERLYVELTNAVISASTLLDAPNPFVDPATTDSNVMLVLNDTNDLEQVVRYYQDVVKYHDVDYVILGEPRNKGYTDNILRRIKERCTCPTKLLFEKDWAIFIINMNDEKLIIKDNTIRIE